MSNKFKKNMLALAIMISFAGVLSSCYYDYGLDPNNSEVVGTLYNTNYNFGAVTRYYLSDTVYHADGSGPNQYDQTILNAMENNLTNNLGWQRVNFRTGDGVITVTSAVTTGTTYVGGGGGYYPYYGYGWYYPPYYGYTYSYETGTVLMSMADYNNPNSDGTVNIEWTGILNSAINQGTSTTSLINTGINQAFSSAQSPYLYQ